MVSNNKFAAIPIRFVLLTGLCFLLNWYFWLLPNLKHYLPPFTLTPLPWWYFHNPQLHSVHFKYLRDLELNIHAISLKSSHTPSALIFKNSLASMTRALCVLSLTVISKLFKISTTFKRILQLHCSEGV